MTVTEEQLVKLVHRMKCCGNCRYRYVGGIVPTCNLHKLYCLDKGACKDWAIELEEEK